jgi:hypothetical protein
LFVCALGSIVDFQGAFSGGLGIPIMLITLSSGALRRLLLESPCSILHGFPKRSAESGNDTQSISGEAVRSPRHEQWFPDRTAR